MKIIDCFPYFNEVELLELRIHLLKEVVDHFVISDANRTHTGISKPFTCKDTIKQLGLSNLNITVIEVNLPSVEEEPNHLVRENMQRDALSNFIKDGTVAIVSDCDEIMNPEFVKYYASVATNSPNGILRIPMPLLNGRADLQVFNDDQITPKDWASAFMCLPYHVTRHTLSDIRVSRTYNTNTAFENIFAVDNNEIQMAGWHFSWMGNSDRIKLKYNSTFDAKYVISSVSADKMIEFIEKYVPSANATDTLGRTDHILRPYPLSKLPKVIFQLDTVRNYLLPEN